MQVEVQAGLKKSDLNKWLKEYDLMFPVDPGSDASVGGYASTGASGTLSIKYGTIRENVVAMKVGSHSAIRCSLLICLHQKGRSGFWTDH